MAIAHSASRGQFRLQSQRQLKLLWQPFAVWQLRQWQRPIQQLGYGVIVAATAGTVAMVATADMASSPSSVTAWLWLGLRPVWALRPWWLVAVTVAMAVWRLRRLWWLRKWLLWQPICKLCQRGRPSSRVNSGVDYATQGETDFRAGRYQEASNDFRHALIDEPNNAALMMLLGQALFATRIISSKLPVRPNSQCRCFPRTSGAR